MTNTEMIIKAMTMTEKEKIRAWNIFVGYTENHVRNCKDKLCDLCRGMEVAVVYVNEEP